MSSTVYGLVLSGGRSRRMGQDKALLEHNGRSQLQHLVELLGAHTDRVFVSVRRDQSDDPERRRYDTIVDRYEGIGPVAGILTALEEYPQCDWLVVACDLPNVDAATLSQLLARRAADKPFTAYRSSHDGLPEPLCAVYRAGTAGPIRQFVEDGVSCPRKILMRSDTALLQLPDPAALDNVNTPEDLAASVLGVAR